MEQEIYKLLIQGGTATAVIVALIFLMKEINSMLKNKSNNNADKRLDILEKFKDNDLHEMVEDINTIQKDIKDLTSRVGNIETTLRIKKIMR